MNNSWLPDAVVFDDETWKRVDPDSGVPLDKFPWKPLEFWKWTMKLPFNDRVFQVVETPKH